MTIYGVAIMAIAALLGTALGDILGQAVHVKANVGGVGFAMIFLVTARVWLEKRGALTPGIKLGVEFWATMYIPVIVAMAADLNVFSASKSGPMVLMAGAASVLSCAIVVAIISRLDKGNSAKWEPPPDVFIDGAAINGPSGPLPDDVASDQTPRTP
jgi:malonate transporter MadL subunit